MLCRLFQNDQPVADRSFVSEDTLIDGVAAVDFIGETDHDGNAWAIFVNNHEHTLELDPGDSLAMAAMVDTSSIISTAEAMTAHVSALSSEDRQRYEALQQLEGERRSLWEEGAFAAASAGDAAADASTRTRRQPVYTAEPRALPPLKQATFEQWKANIQNPTHTIVSFDSSVWDRHDVLPSVVFYAGMGGISTGSHVYRDGFHIITAVAIEAEEAECATHRLNNPSVPVLQMRMVNHEQVLEAVAKYLPRRHWRRLWAHASNSCKKASSSNMFGRDMEVARQDTVWAIALLQKLKPAIWTLENVPTLHEYFRGLYPTAYIFKLANHCELAQDRKRMIIASRTITLPRIATELSMRDVLGSKKGWLPGQKYLARNAWGTPRSVDQRAPTITSGHIQAGAQTVGEFSPKDILTAEDRAILQGFQPVPSWPSRLGEYARRKMVAQCVPPPFAAVLSRAAFEYQLQALQSMRLQARLAFVDEYEFRGSESADDLVELAHSITLPQETALVSRAEHRRDVEYTPSASLYNLESQWDTGTHRDPNLATADPTVRASTEAARRDHDLTQGQQQVLKLGKHGRWKCLGEYGWCRVSESTQRHISTVATSPWLICINPPRSSESHSEFHRRRELEKLELCKQLLEQAHMAAEDGNSEEARRSRTVAAKLSHHFTNVHTNSELLASEDANADLQKSQPHLYGPYLMPGETYKTHRTVENWEKACAEMGLDDLHDDDKSEREFYADLVWHLWVLFDDKLRAVAGVEIDLDLSDVKPLRAHPYRWSPAKVEAGRKLIQEFVEEGIMRPITSDWASPALLVPKPKGGWRLVIDLRELNKHIPQDGYEPPGCDLCLEWLGGRPYRTTADMRWGFHQLLLSERTQKIFTLITPFGTFAYQRLVMGYINATAEFQRHVNNTLGPCLWEMCLSMVDDLCVASETKEQHRLHVTSVFTRLAQRQHSIKPSKAHILRRIIEYLGHLSTPNGTKATGKHVQAIVDMPAPMADDLVTVDKTKVRSFLGLTKFVRRYIPDCGRRCEPLNRLTTDNSDGNWGLEQQMVFDGIKRDIAFHKGVYHPNFKLPLFICSDGSKRGIGGYLFQNVDGEERVISYFSRATTKDERKWDTRELEVLALIATLEYFRHYIEGQKIFLMTDHKNITWLSNVKGRSDRLGRWILRLSEFNAHVSYRKGKFMHIADCMSRNSVAPQEEALITADLPSWGAMVQPGWLDALLDVFMVDADVEDDELDTLCAHTGPELVITELNPGDAQAFSCSALHQLDFVIPDQQQSALDSQEYAWQDAAARARRLLEGDRNRNMGGEISQALELCESDRARQAEFDQQYDSDEEGAHWQDACESFGLDAEDTEYGDGDEEYFEAHGDAGDGTSADPHSVGTYVADPASAAEEQPFTMPDSLMPTPLSTQQLKAEQQKDTFAIELITELKRFEEGQTLSRRAAKFAMLEGVLYRITEASDPKEGYDSARVYVPESLRAQVLRNHHSSVWGAHQNETSTFKSVAALYFWPQMDKSVADFVKNCRYCELAKGTKPTRQGFLHGWKHNSVNTMITMDLVGPIGATDTGHVMHKTPLYILVITDPFSHMLWMEPITGKSAEEVYQRFVNGYLLEEGTPLFILTDNGGEFKNALLKEVMRLLKVRLQFTPSYHPRGNYTERVNRFIGESLRTMLNMPGARKQDWWKFTKFVQFAYRRMFIPGTNLSPYMVARGRQPTLPSEIERQQLGDALPSFDTLSAHVKLLNANMVLAAQLLRVARAKVLQITREKFNQHQVEVTFSPGERVRLHKRVPVVHGANPDEVSSKLKLFNFEYEIIGPVGDSKTRYYIRNVVTGAETDAYINQIARMRSKHAPEEPPIELVTPQEHERIWDRLRENTMALIWRTDDDARSMLRVVEVLEKHDDGFLGWFYCHGGKAARGTYNHERPVIEMRCIPEWRNDKTGFAEHKVDEAKKKYCSKVTQSFTTQDVEVICSGWHLHTGGKVPAPVIAKADQWLRRAVKVEPRAVLAISNPTQTELSKRRSLK